MKLFLKLADRYESTPEQLEAFVLSLPVFKKTAVGTKTQIIFSLEDQKKAEDGLIEFESGKRKSFFLFANEIGFRRQFETWKAVQPMLLDLKDGKKIKI